MWHGWSSGYRLPPIALVQDYVPAQACIKSVVMCYFQASVADIASCGFGSLPCTQGRRGEWARTTLLSRLQIMLVLLMPLAQKDVILRFIRFYQQKHISFRHLVARFSNAPRSFEKGFERYPGQSTEPWLSFRHSDSRVLCLMHINRSRFSRTRTR